MSDKHNLYFYNIKKYRLTNKKHSKDVLLRRIMLGFKKPFSVWFMIRYIKVKYDLNVNEYIINREIDGLLDINKLICISYYCGISNEKKLDVTKLYISDAFFRKM